VKGMELRLESAAGVILREPFEMQPRSLARARALRESLKRRGWNEINPKPQVPNPKSQ
jgi:BMFP domain-containing protein YqiC